MATYAIGDVQGCYSELKELLSKIRFNSDCDQLWFCGDLVNRGPQSLQTLRYIRDLGDNAITVLGNHDLHLLAIAYCNNAPGKKDTLDEILSATDRDKLLDWLRCQPLMHHDKKLAVTLVHAGIHPFWSIKKALRLAGEVQSILCGDEHTGYYQHMYGDKPKRWEDDLEGWARYRFIINTFTRMRFCDRDGKHYLNTKCAPGKQPDGLYPWYETPGRKTIDDRIIFGHWSTLPHAGKKVINNTYAIDSGCLWGGRLTAMRIDDKTFEYTRLKCRQKQKPSLKPSTDCAA